MSKLNNYLQNVIDGKESYKLHSNMNSSRIAVGWMTSHFTAVLPTLSYLTQTIPVLFNLQLNPYSTCQIACMFGSSSGIDNLLDYVYVFLKSS